MVLDLMAKKSHEAQRTHGGRIPGSAAIGAIGRRVGSPDATAPAFVVRRKSAGGRHPPFPCRSNHLGLLVLVIALYGLGLANMNMSLLNRLLKAMVGILKVLQG